MLSSRSVPRVENGCLGVNGSSSGREVLCSAAAWFRSSGEALIDSGDRCSSHTSKAFLDLYGPTVQKRDKG